MFNYSTLLEKYILKLGDWLLNSTFTQQIKLIRAEMIKSEEELTFLQRDKLQKVLNHSVVKSHYYSALNIKSDTDPIKWLKNFPILTKQLLTKNVDEILTVTEGKLYKHSSSGSTGVRSTVYWTPVEQDRHRVSQVVWWEWSGYKMGMPILQTGMTTNRGLVKTLKDFFFRTYYLNAFVHTKKQSEKALQWAKRQKECILGGYASSLYVLAQQTERNSEVAFKSVITWGDKLFDHYRHEIEKKFNTKVYETYGAAEGLMIAAQKDLPYMYLMTNNVYLELLDDEGNEVEDGQIGRVVITSLNAFAMPLIRYQLGDLAIRLPRNRYPKERQLNFPILQKVIGRDTDLIKTTSGKYMVVHSFTGIFEHISEVKQFCIIQRSLSGIEIEYIPSDNFKFEVLDSVKRMILDALEEDFVISFKEVKEIKPTQSGKPQIIQSFLPKI